MKNLTILFGLFVLVAMTLVPESAMAIRGAHPNKLAVGAAGSFIAPGTPDTREAGLSALYPLTPDNRLLLQPKLYFDFQHRSKIDNAGALMLGSGLYYDVIENTNLSIYAGGGLGFVAGFEKDNSYGIDFNGGLGCRFHFTEIPELYFSAETGLGLRIFFNGAEGAGVRGFLGGVIPFMAGIFFQL